jgi:hypothetical protein
MAMDYLDHLKADPERLRTLRLIEATSTDDRTINWAKHEETLVENDIAALKSEIAAKQTEVDAPRDSRPPRSPTTVPKRRRSSERQRELERLRSQLEPAIEVVENFDLC